VAFVLGKVIHEFDTKGIVVSEEMLETRLRVLIKLKQIEPAGNVSRWRFSEVRLPVSGEPSK
jgi:predicted metalloenzyme YecM